MFQKIQHIGYYTTDLDGAVGWFEKSFGAVNAGGGPMQQSYAVPSGGRNAYVRFGHVEAEIIETELVNEAEEFSVTTNDDEDEELDAFLADFDDDEF